MAKHKKKPSQHQLDKIAEARRRNQFFYKLNYLITALTGDPSVFKLIPQKEYDTVFALRVRAPRVKAAPDNILNPESIEMIRQVLFHRFKIVTVNYTSAGPEITLDMFFTVGLFLWGYLSVLEDDEYPAAAELKKRLAIVTDDSRMDEGPMGVLEYGLHDPVEKISIVLSNIEDILCWMTIKHIKDDTYLRPSQYYEISIHSYKPKKIRLVAENNARPAYELCWGTRHKGLRKVEIPAEKLELPADNYPKSLPVYIQAHTLNRLIERLDCVDSSLLPDLMIDTFDRFSYCKSADNSYLVAFNVYSKKIGYLVARVHDGIFLLHSFLFITNSGTPEGNRLAKLTKLNKLDMQYLTIDKLSAFYTSDIADNPEVKKLFIDAGCGDLFNIYPWVMQNETIDHKKPLADKILSYLNLTTSDDDLKTYRKEQMPV